MKRCKHGVEGFLGIIGVFSLALAAFLGTGASCLAQEAQAPGPSAMPAAEATGEGVAALSDRVTINVNGGTLSGALAAFQRQTGRNVVQGSSVSNATITVNLKDTPWQEALDVMLKPYGFGYKVVGQTVVVNQSKDMAALEDVEPLVSEVFTLKYLDAAAVVEIVQKLLTPGRGSVSVLQSQAEKGWEFGSGVKSGGGGSGSGSGVSTSDKRQRVGGGSDRTRSKTVIVKDTPTVVQSVGKIIAEIDHMPTQILIESRFVEVNSGFLRDLGLEWGTGATGAEIPGVQAQGHSQGGNLFGIGAQQLGGGVTPAAFSQDAASSSVRPFNTGLAIKFQQLTGTQFEMLLHMLEEDNSANILSAPRVLTLNNQEATITVGTQFPIIKSDVSGGTSGGGGISTTLDYYQDIGIQLNVVPQVCGSNYVSLIVHPAVTEQIGVENGQSQSALGQTVLTSYPVLSTREAETQIILKSGTTVMIGGLLKNKDAKSQLKVPLLGDIPVLGQLFRRDTKTKEKLDLLIFLTASIMPTEAMLEQEAETLGRAKSEAARGADLIAAAQANAAKEIKVEREARLNAEQKSQTDVAARLAAENRAAQSEQAQFAAEKAGAAAEQRARQAAEFSVRTEREAHAASEKARLAAEKESRAEAAREAERARLAAEKKARAEAAAEQKAAKARLAAERKAKAEAEARAEAAQEAQAKAAREAERARVAAEKKAKAEAAAKAAAEREAAEARLAAERKAQARAEARAEAAREAQAKAVKEAERARLAAEKKAKAEAAAEQKAAKARLAAERKAKAEAEARAEAAREAQAKAARDAERARIAAEKKAKADAEARAEAEKEAQAKAAKEAARQRLAAEKEAKENLARYNKARQGGAPVPPVVMESPDAASAGVSAVAGQTP